MLILLCYSLRQKSVQKCLLKAGSPSSLAAFHLQLLVLIRNVSSVTVENAEAKWPVRGATD